VPVPQVIPVIRQQILAKKLPRARKINTPAKARILAKVREAADRPKAKMTARERVNAGPTVSQCLKKVKHEQSPHPYVRSWLLFFSFCDGVGFDSLSLTRFGSRHKCQGTTLVVP
jgi:hypothetical protein